MKFHRFVIQARQRCGYSLARIFNMDETPMWFELPSSRTLEFSGGRTVPVKSCGAEKRSFTVTLAVAADGKKIPPAVIFKGVRTPRDLVVPDSVRVSFHKKGWMDEAGKLVVLFCFMSAFFAMFWLPLIFIFYRFQVLRSGFALACQEVLWMSGHCWCGIRSVLT